MTNKQIALWSLAVTAIGVAVAIFQLTRSDRNPVPVSTTNVAGNADCSPVGTQGGNVVVNCNHNTTIAAPPTPSFRSFEGPVDYDNITEFSNFIEANEGKIVRLSLHFNSGSLTEAVRWDADDGIPDMPRLVMTHLTSCANGSSGCTGSGGVEYVFVPDRGGDQAYYPCVAGDFCVDGYYSIEPVQGMHQGIISIGIVRIPNAQARLADPAAR